MKRVRAFILAGVLASLAFSATPAMASDFVGIVSVDTFAGDSPYQNTAFTQQRDLGIGIIRQTFDWANIELKRGQYDWTYYDAFVQAAASHGIQVLPILFNPPKFRSSKPKKHAKHGTYFPKKSSDLGAFGAEVAKRYGPNGTMWDQRKDVPKLPITAYQIWNEPNLAAYSPPKPSARKYVAMLKAVGPAIHAVDPAAEIVTAGLPDSRLSKPNLYKFITQMYQAGAKGTFNTLGVNPYATSAAGLIGKLKKIRGIMNRFGDSQSKIWLTELGWSDSGPKAPFRVGAAGQAQRITDAVAAIKANETTLNLRGFFYFSWRDVPVYAGFHDFWGLHTGLLRKDGTPKPAFEAFKQAVAAL
jgi:hypothetical protein